MTKHNVKKEVSKILEAMENNGGATLEGFKPVTYDDGYQVGIAGVIVDNVSDAEKAIDLYNGNCGVWYSEGLYYIDNSVHIENKRDALTIGKACEQQSILQWDGMHLIFLD